VGQITIPNRPAGSATRVIAAILADFDAILAQANGNLQADVNVAVAAAAAQDGNANAEGVSSSLARADHKHLIQGVERRAANPASDHFVGRVYFNTTSNRLIVCTDATTPVYVPVPGIVSAARAFRASGQSVLTSTVVVLLLDSERFDTETIHDNAVNHSRLTCKTAGIYAIDGSAVFEANATGNRQLKILLNGTTEIDSVNVPAAGGAADTHLSVSTIYQLAVNDYVELAVRQTSGVTLNVLQVGNVSPEFGMVRVG
jgi:hypothetical protein